MSSKILIPCAAATMTCLSAVALSSAPASAQYYGGGYCAYHPHDPVCLAGVVAPYVHHYHDHDDHYHDEHYHDHHHHDHDHHDHDHDHDHDHHHHH